MAKFGRPTKYNPKFHPENFIALSEQGKTLSQIARAWQIHRETLWMWGKRHKEFADTIKKGRQIAEAWYMDLGQAAMVGAATLDGRKINVNLGMFCWLTKNMFKWSDKIVMKEREDEADEDPCKDLTDEELDAM